MYVILVQPKTAEDSTVSAPPEFLSRSIESIKYSTVNCRIRFEHVNDSKKEQRTSTIQKKLFIAMHETKISRLKRESNELYEPKSGKGDIC
jgi:hypothetical protein